MSGFDKADNNLTTGAPVTHIGPETGNTANATDGGESGAGTNEEGSPPAAARGSTANKAKLAEHEPSSFQPTGADRGDLGSRSRTGPIDTDEDLIQRIADGDDTADHGHRR
jgi:hypothetical protein